MKTVLKKILLCISFIIVVGGITTAAVWADMQARSRLCRGVRVHILNEQQVQFVTKQSILAALDKAQLNPQGKPLAEIDTDIIEQYIASSEFMENVECYIDAHNFFVIEASQLVPVLRVFDGNRSYYVNREGKCMSAAKSYHVDVPVVEGHFSRQWPPTKLIPMLDYVAADKALNQLVTMWVVRDSCNVCFVPSIRGHIVNMGSPTDYQSKFAKLMKFYKDVLSVKGWETYTEISLKWNYQVVGTLRNKKPLTEPDYDPDYDDQAPDVASIDMEQLKREDSIASASANNAKLKKKS